MFFNRPAAALSPSRTDSLRREEVEALKDISRELSRLRETLRQTSAIGEIPREIARLRDVTSACNKR